MRAFSCLYETHHVSARILLTPTPGHPRPVGQLASDRIVGGRQHVRRRDDWHGTHHPAGLAEAEFGITSKTAVVSFIATFGLAKAGSNLLVGPIAQRFTRRRILIAGWMIGIPVPLLLIWAPACYWA